MPESFLTFDVFPILQLTFTDLKANASTLHKFSIRREIEFLKIKSTGELFFDMYLYKNEPKHIKNLLVRVENLQTGQTASTKLQLTLQETHRDEFCFKHSCFYDNIRYVTKEFDHTKELKAQIIGDLNPLMYQKLCDSIDNLLKYFLSIKGTEFVSLSTKNELVKLNQLDYESQVDHSLLIEVACEVQHERLQKYETRRKLLNITVIDINDNKIVVDRNSANVDIYYHKSEFFE